MNSITQDMKYRQSLLTYALKYGVSRASREKRSYIYFWLARLRWFALLACQSRRPHRPQATHPERTQTYLDMEETEIVELWVRPGYTGRKPVALPAAEYKPKPYGPWSTCPDASLHRGVMYSDRVLGA